jgi:hypothetical protein
MARVPFVCAQVDGAIDEDRQLHVHLDQALRVALVPVVAAPRPVRHQLEHEALTRRQVETRRVRRRASSMAARNTVSSRSGE